MPTYEYECRDCGNKFELFQSITAHTVTECTKCGKEAKRLIGAGAGFIFKGSGFYATDYRKKPEEANEKKEGPPPVCPMNKECKGCDGKDKAV